MQQCWRIPAGGVFGRAETGHRRPSRSPALQAFAKLKYKANIAQNHSRKSAWTNIDYDRLYTQPSYNPGRQLGSVKLQPIPGRGRGLVAQRDIPLAETVLLSEAVGGVLSGPEGTELRPQHLADHLAALQRAGALGQPDRARLRLLYDGSAADSPMALRNRAASLDDFRKLEDKLRRVAEAPKKAKGKGFGAPAAAAAAGAAGQAGSGIDTVTLGEAPLEGEELSRLASLNAWGNSFGELGASALRGEASEAVIGIWPEFALVNHACAPNTTAFAVGQRLLLQAVRDIPRGGEVTTSYLAEMALAPLERRREWLRGAYGFECACERCTAEASVPPAVSAAVDAAYAAASSEEARALAGQAAGRSDRGALAPLEAAVAAAVEALEEAMQEAGLEEQLRAWLRASAYNAYYTRAAIRDLPEGGAGPGGLLFGSRGATAKAPFSDPEVPAGLAAVVSEVAAGSDLHLFLTLEALSRSAEAFPRDDPRVVEATKTCLHAHILRYGRTSDDVLKQLVQARIAHPHYLGRISLASSQQQQQQEPDSSNAQQSGQSRPGDAGSLVSEPLLGSAAWVAASPVQLRDAAAAAAAELAAGMGTGQAAAAPGGV
ncbi:hypothetical protein PLESTB_000310500 [Pleodorina starrii]|uniref:SET domain-containing protein n=1 Tax=Pleodorina starrii TaxID=330485 RepID=A0A9W6BCZ3_9CHLO|nr:hypothetical protein PLESTM_001720900 [Pleodorina starrii]GLC49804.1 hypothetical protein PLESTB_000310500 [Pleodorina starrii]GLC76237.1 hypothetical protein PLESTF_001754000 [Pleodorina starrii]